MAIPALSFENYFHLSTDECHYRIKIAKQKLGSNLLILGHHYQREEVYQHADFTGDSLGLSQQAAKSNSRYIIFCGVHFMAEVSAIMTAPTQSTLLPDLKAGCSMADMANVPNVERSWREIGAVLDVEANVTPITYVNSSAALKAFCGRHHGITCTSTNARQVLEWALKQREKVLFFPDQHLGRNTAYRMGIGLDEMVVWNYTEPNGGLSTEQIRRAKIILWQGYCSVHNKFKPEHIEEYLSDYPEAKIIAHPEACFEVCQRADFVGSTSYIIDVVKNAPDNSHFLVATELNLVNRLQERYRESGKIIRFMAPTVSMCSTMFRTDPQHLLWLLEGLLQNQIINQITVPAGIAAEAKVALARMFAVS